MKCYWDAFLDEILAGKIEDGHEDANGNLDKNIVRLQTATPAQLLRLFYQYLDDQKVILK
jgi:hypothetical protein